MQKATLSTLDNQSCGVIVKSVSDNDPDALRLFFVEMSTLVQFYHPNVQMLHGTMLRPSEAVVCVESVSQGPLDAVLRENPMQFSLMQLVHILRGIACGMQYLAELGYVHKVSIIKEKPQNPNLNETKQTGIGKKKKHQIRTDGDRKEKITYQNFRKMSLFTEFKESDISSNESSVGYSNQNFPSSSR